MKHLLVTGGAGYIGSVLCKLLLRHGHRVTVVDNLMYGGEPIVELLNDASFSFEKCDIRDRDQLEAVFQKAKFDAVLHLAAIVGDPACARQPDLTRATNLDASIALYQLAEQYGVGRFVFSSTCSNYGKMKDPSAFVTEDSELAPVSLYAETKVAFEQYLLSQPRSNRCKPVCLRFSTVYGLSPRPRFDLTVNEFSKELAMGRELVIFGEQFWRPYCHVVDLARAVMLCTEVPESDIAFEVYNVGDTSENYTKKMIVSEIEQQLPGCQVKYVQKNEDPRDYRVNFDKIRDRLGFRITLNVPQGIAQTIHAVQAGFFGNPDDPKYKNVS
jgi:nucleoside-diphosphate-sugar epimerase